jgi:hypothetical protein
MNKKARLQINYQIGRTSGRLQIQIIHPKPIFGDVEIISVCPVVNLSRHIRISGVGQDKYAVVMEVGLCKGKENLKVRGRTHVPRRNIGRGCGDARHTKVLRHIRKEQINPCVQLRLGVWTSTPSSNLEVKIQKNIKNYGGALGDELGKKRLSHLP